VAPSIHRYARDTSIAAKRVKCTAEPFHPPDVKTIKSLLSGSRSRRAHFQRKIDIPKRRSFRRRRRRRWKARDRSTFNQTANVLEISLSLETIERTRRGLKNARARPPRPIDSFVSASVLSFVLRPGFAYIRSGYIPAARERARIPETQHRDRADGPSSSS